MRYESPNITSSSKATLVVLNGNHLTKATTCAADGGSGVNAYTAGAYEVDE